MPNHPAVKRHQARNHRHICLATVPNRPAVKPVRAEPQAGCWIGRLKRMKKRRYSCFIDPGRAVFPSDADLHRRRFPSQRRYSESFYRIDGPSSSGKDAARRLGAHYPRFKGPGKGGRPYLLDGRAVETGSSTTSGYRFHRASVWLPCRITRLSNVFRARFPPSPVWLPCRITRPPNRCGRSRRPDAESGVQTG